MAVLAAAASAIPARRPLAAHQKPGGVSYFSHYLAGRWTRSRVPARPAGALDVTALALIPGTRSLWASSVVDLGFGTTKGAAILKYGS